VPGPLRLVDDPLGSVYQHDRTLQLPALGRSSRRERRDRRGRCQERETEVARRTPQPGQGRKPLMFLSIHLVRFLSHHFK